MMSERRKDENIKHEEVMEMFKTLNESINARFDGVDKKLDPMYSIYSTSSTLAKVTISFTKFLIKLSAFLVAIGTIYLFFKKILTGHL